MKEFVFWLRVPKLSGAIEMVEFKFSAANWTDARKQMSAAYQQVRSQ
jgi:hypothetical protein